MKLTLTLMAFLVGMTAYSIALRNNNLLLMEDNAKLKKEKCDALQKHNMLSSQIAEGLCLPRLAMEVHNG